MSISNKVNTSSQEEFEQMAGNGTGGPWGNGGGNRGSGNNGGGDRPPSNGDKVQIQMTWFERGKNNCAY